MRNADALRREWHKMRLTKFSYNDSIVDENSSNQSPPAGDSAGQSLVPHYEDDSEPEDGSTDWRVNSPGIEQIPQSRTSTRRGTSKLARRRHFVTLLEMNGGKELSSWEPFLIDQWIPAGQRAVAQDLASGRATGQAQETATSSHEELASQWATLDGRLRRLRDSQVAEDLQRGLSSSTAH